MFGPRGDSSMKALVLFALCATLAAARPMENQPGLHIPVSTVITADLALVSDV